MIIASAVKLKSGQVFVGKRHGDCYANIKFLGLEKKDCIESVQGFITAGLTFLNREDAYYDAFMNNQCRKQEYKSKIYATGLEVKKEDWKPYLSSEDLW